MRCRVFMNRVSNQIVGKCVIKKVYVFIGKICPIACSPEYVHKDGWISRLPDIAILWNFKMAVVGSVRRNSISCPAMFDQDRQFYTSTL